MRSRVTSALAAGAFLLLSLLGAAPASASQGHHRSVHTPPAHSGVIQLIKAQQPRIAAAQSSNWFGYDLGALEQKKLFTQVSATWTVPAATQHQEGQEESSATWVGIGGGCVNQGCTISDPTGLIQTGTEQNVSANGSASYGAWWELVPIPSIPIEGLTISPGDRIEADISEVSPQELLQPLGELPQILKAGGTPGLGIWRITLTDLTTRQSFSKTVPYPSSHASAEWIEETPLAISTSGTGFTGLPDLSETPFANAKANGAQVKLSPSQEIDLTTESGEVIGSVSSPSTEGDGFFACAWSSVCPAPAG